MPKIIPHKTKMQVLRHIQYIKRLQPDMAQNMAVVEAALGGDLKLSRDMEDITVKFLECIREALDGGLPSAGIPDHNPLLLQNLSFPIDKGVLNGSLRLINGQIHHLTEFNVKKVVGKHSDNRIVFDYVLNYDSTLMEYDYELHTEGVYNVDQTGKISIDMINMDLVGVWNMTMDPKCLDDFDLKLAVNKANVQITGLGIRGPIYNYDLGYLLTEAINENIITFSSFLESRINEKWLDPDHLYRIDAILANCHS